MGGKRDVVVAEHAADLALHAPQCRHALDILELEHCDSPLTVPDQDDEVEYADLGSLHQLGQGRNNGGERVLIWHRDDDVLDEVTGDLVAAVGRLSSLRHRIDATPCSTCSCRSIIAPQRVVEDHPAAGGGGAPPRAPPCGGPIKRGRRSSSIWTK